MAISAVVASAVVALAAGGGGGGGGTVTLPQLGGNWTGQISFPAPPSLTQAILTLNQDAAGNLTGQLCTQFCAPATGRLNTDGSFEVRGENYDMKGRIVGTATCADGTVTSWISGGVQERGSTGAFSFLKCQ
jgi:hypothetical protein